MRNKKNIIFLFSVGIITIIMAMIPTGFDNPSLTENVLYEKGEILETFDEGLQEISVVTIGIQKLKIKLLSGEFKDSVFVAENVLNGQKNIDKVFSKGDKALIVITLDKVSRQPLTIKAQDFYRLDIELILVAVFVLALLAFAGFTGLKAVLSFVFTALCFWKLLLPMYLNGYNPFLTGILITFVTAAVVILLVSGIGKKGFTALCGCFCG
ncbi:MAG: YibE/F family protein, partial [Bacteroidales bacterium]|nr:YibE/F family protein [Bacteroidales bacterium]